MGPLSQSDLPDAVAFAEETVPRLAAGIEDGGVVGVHPIGQLGLAQVLPNVLPKIETKLLSKS